MQNQSGILALASIGIFAVVAVAFVIGLFLGLARPRLTPWGLDRLDTGCLLGALLLVFGCMYVLVHVQALWGIAMLVLAFLLLGVTYGRAKRS